MNVNERASEGRWRLIKNKDSPAAEEGLQALFGQRRRKKKKEQKGKMCFGVSGSRGSRNPKQRVPVTQGLQHVAQIFGYSRLQPETLDRLRSVPRLRGLRVQRRGPWREPVASARS